MKKKKGNQSQKKKAHAYVKRNFPLIKRYLDEGHNLKVIYDSFLNSDDPPPIKIGAFRYQLKKLEDQPDKIKADAAKPDREKEKENNPDHKPRLGEKGWKPKEAKKKLFKTFNHNPVADPDELI